MRVRDITPEWCAEHLSGWEYDARTKQGKAWCPVHPDEGTTLKGLSVSFASSQPRLYCHTPECHATGTAVLKACENGTVDVEVAYQAVSVLRRIVEVYEYTDEHGEVLYRIARYDPKDFRPVNAKRKVVSFNERPVPYNLPLLLKATEVWVVDGEKDANRAHDEGLTATCFAKSAGGWRPEFALYFHSKDVVIVQDKRGGEKQAREIARDLHGVAASVRIVVSRGENDLFDHFADGYSVDEFIEVELEEYALSNGRRIRTTSFADISSKEIHWLWDGRIPRGAVALLAGMPGMGKTLFLCSLVAGVSRGEFGDNTKVLFATAEDSAAHTLKPRLIAAGANLYNVFHLYSTIVDSEGRDVATGSFSLPSDVEPLSAAVEEHRPALLVIDPLLAHLDSSINSWKDESARQAMTPLTALAEEHGCAVLCAMHLNKRREVDPLIRLGGSLGGIAGPARAIFFFGESGDERLLVHTKHNLSAKQPTLVYAVDTCRVRLDDGATAEVGKVVLTGETDRGVEAILTQDDSHTPIEDAVAFLQETLRDGAVPVKQVQGEAKAEGISQSTLQRAKERLGVTSHREGFGADGKWVWDLPPILTATPIRSQAHEDDA